MDALGRTEEIVHKPSIRGKIEIGEDGSRNLRINRLRGYDLDSFLGFMDYAQSKFKKIVASVEYDRPGQIKNLILSGFGMNVELTQSDKEKLIESLAQGLSTKNKKVKDKLLSELRASKNLADFVASLVKKGFISPGEPVYDTMVKLLKEKGVKELEFRSVDNGIEYTLSQHILHSVQLQRSPDNDYHKGFRKYRRLVPGLNY